MNEIFVIVENVSVVERGEYDVEEVICSTAGFFTDENAVEAKVNALNKKYVEDLGHRATEDDETRFGYISMSKAK